MRVGLKNFGRISLQKYLIKMVIKTKNKNWFRRHWIISIVLGLIILGTIGNISNGNISNINSQSKQTEESKENLQIQDSVEVCNPNWQCKEWSECSSSGIRTRTCTDSNNCNILTDKPEESQSCTFKISLITKSPEDMLPLPSELPTEYSIGKKKDITKESPIITSRNAEEGFDSGKQLSISKYKIGTYTVTDYIEITFGVYKFVDSNYASNFKNTVMNAVKNDGGYTELSVSANAECFSWKEDYGYSAGRIGQSICYNKNVVYWVDVTITNSFKQPNNYLKDMIKIVDAKVR